MRELVIDSETDDWKDVINSSLGVADFNVTMTLEDFTYDF